MVNKATELSKYKLLKNVVKEITDIKTDTNLKDLLRNYLNELDGNTKLTTFCDWVRDDLATATELQISTQILAVVGNKKNRNGLSKINQ